MNKNGYLRPISAKTFIFSRLVGGGGGGGVRPKRKVKTFVPNCTFWGLVPSGHLVHHQKVSSHELP